MLNNTLNSMLPIKESTETSVIWEPFIERKCYVSEAQAQETEVSE